MRPTDKPLTLAEMRAMQEAEGSITAVISFPWDGVGDIEALNDAASELITGNECALEGMSYRLVGVDLDKQEVLLEVCGTVEDWIAEQDEEIGSHDGND